MFTVNGAASASTYSVSAAFGSLLPLQAVVGTQLAALVDAIGTAQPTLASAVPAGGAAAPGAVAEVFGRLAALLAADDFSSGQVLEEHQALLQAAMGVRFEAFARAVLDFDSGHALELLQACAAEQGIAL